MYFIAMVARHKPATKLKDDALFPSTYFSAIIPNAENQTVSGITFEELYVQAKHACYEYITVNGIEDIQYTSENILAQCDYVNNFPMVIEV